jgi:hypothetical protein
MPKPFRSPRLSVWPSLLASFGTLVISIVFTSCLHTEAKAEAAFAFGRAPGGRWWYGSATDMDSARTAANLAMQRCQSSGPHCQLMRQFKLGCFAFSASQNGALGFAMGGNQQEADARANAMCAQYRGSQCAVRYSFCDSVSEQLATAVQRAKMERARLIATSNGTSCNLSGKAIIYNYTTCELGKGCHPTKNFVEIVRDKVLNQMNPQQSGSGIVYNLGKTVDVTNEFAKMRPFVAQQDPRFIPRTLATAAFDGRTLTLRLDETRYSHNFAPFRNNLLLAYFSIVDRIAIQSCRTCLLQQSSITVQGASGPPVIMSGTNASCRIESMN